MTGKVGSVTWQRYDELVKLGRDWVEKAVTRGEDYVDEQLQELLKGAGE
ncbi:hypothetical protein ACIPRD_31335 [Streptomyces sp. NPDC090108]